MACGTAWPAALSPNFFLHCRRNGQSYMFMVGPRPCHRQFFAVIKKSQIPSVITFHDYFYACPNGAFYLYQKDALCTLKPMSAACLLTSCDSRKPSHKFFRVARQLIQTEIGGMREAFGNIVFVSELSRSLLSPYCAKTLHSHVITNPVNVEPNDPARPEQLFRCGRAIVCRERLPALC
jgi:hypothetical protein